MATPGAPHKRFAAVDAQIADFDEELWRTIEFQLLVNINRTYWYENDKLDVSAINGISWAIDYGCREMIERYKGTTIERILDEFKQILGMMLRVSVDVPWPADPDLHIERIIANVRTEIDYRRPAILGDELEVHGRLGESTPARFWCHFEIRRPRDGALLITCQQALAFVKMPEGKPLRLPKGWPEPFAPEV